MLLIQIQIQKTLLSVMTENLLRHGSAYSVLYEFREVDQKRILEIRQKLEEAESLSHKTQVGVLTP